MSQSIDHDWRRREVAKIRQRITDLIAAMSGNGVVGMVFNKDGTGAKFWPTRNEDRLSRYLQEAVDQYGKVLSAEQIDEVVIREASHLGLAGLTGKQLIE